MKRSSIILLAGLVAIAASARYEHYPALEAVSMSDDAAEPVYDSSKHTRTKRGLLLLKKKLLLGALGLKAAKIGAIGAGALGVLALKKKSASSGQTQVSVSSGHSGYGSEHSSGGYGGSQGGGYGYSSWSR